MSVPALAVPQWNAVPLTKFRPPRLRRDVIRRASLYQRLLVSVENNPVTIVCAPGGSGKTTLLAQLSADAGHHSTILWVSIDQDDNDINRLFATLVQALEPLNLTWDVAPQSLLDTVGGSKAQLRAALAALVNAVCTVAAPRIVLILDDLHRLEKPEAFELLESLIERLPDHVALVLGSRIEPPLALARWRAYGELESLNATDLQFNAEEAIAFAAARFGRSLDETAVREALGRTHGWAAGLMLLLQSRAGLHDEGSVPRADGSDAQRHLFAYLAQEVLEELPLDLQDFLLRSSILIELSPRLCAVLTERSDAREVLESLYRRNLFLTAVDEMTPVLRFHDLFRDFLEAELAVRDPALKRQLHVQAAREERIASRAIYHLLAARRWDEAMRRIVEAGEERITHGGIATVERWIDAIPTDIRDNAAVAYLRGTCAWFRWDWPRAKRELTLAVDGLTAPEQNAQRVRALFHLVDALNSSGERAQASVRVEQASQLPLDTLGQAELALQRAWCLSPAGEPVAVARHMREFVEFVERDPAAICPAVADRIHCMLIGIPGVAETFERFYNAYLKTRGGADQPWHISALTIGAWAHAWRGRRSELLATLEQAEHLQHQFGAVRLVTERLAQLKALANVLLGNHENALAIMHTHIDVMRSAELAGHGAVWLRPYRHGLGRACWVAQDLTNFREVLPHLIAPPNPGEWPFVSMAAQVTRAQLALFEENWRDAERILRECLPQHAQLRLPMIHADVRLALAYAQVMQGKKAEAWASFASMFEEIVAERAVGLLLLEPRKIVNEILDAAPPEVKKSADYLQLREQLHVWGESTAKDVTTGGAGPLTVLSQREYEVLDKVAAGASNKHIARDLALSLHTVKRHIANILDKLNCDSRGQAADLFRRHMG
jgi:LuxR family maltose regulon positive regulatory protein